MKNIEDLLDALDNLDKKELYNEIAKTIARDVKLKYEEEMQEHFTFEQSQAICNTVANITIPVLETYFRNIRAQIRRCLK